MNDYKVLLETDPTIAARELSTSYADNGYVFLRGVLDAAKIERVRDQVIGELKRHGFARPESSDFPLWSEKSPESDEMLPNGSIIGSLAASGILGELSRVPELLAALGKILGGDIFAWQDSDARLRIVLGDKVSRDGDSAGGPQFSFSTPPHQDYYFFRPVRFCTVCIPLMDISEEVGGLAIRENSHHEGLHDIWWKGKEFLGMATSPEQAHSWKEMGAVSVAGDTDPSDEDRHKSWFRSDFQVGDALVIDNLMIHAGVPNQSDVIRLSADFRYQLKGTPTNWESLCTMGLATKYFSRIMDHLDELDLQPGMFERVWETMRLEGPKTQNHDDLPGRIQALMDQLAA